MVLQPCLPQEKSGEAFPSIERQHPHLGEFFSVSPVEDRVAPKSLLAAVSKHRDLQGHESDRK